MDTFAVTITSSSTPVAFTVSAAYVLRTMNKIVNTTSRSIVAPTAPMRRTSVSCSALNVTGPSPAAARSSSATSTRRFCVGAQEHALDGPDRDRHGDAPLDIELAPHVQFGCQVDAADHDYCEAGHDHLDADRVDRAVQRRQGTRVGFAHGAEQHGIGERRAESEDHGHDVHGQDHFEELHRCDHEQNPIDPGGTCAARPTRTCTRRDRVVYDPVVLHGESERRRVLAEHVLHRAAHLAERAAVLQRLADRGQQVLAAARDIAQLLAGAVPRAPGRGRP